MKWLVGSAVLTAVKAIASEKNVRCAVAFWGASADTLFRDIGKQKPRIICNLTTGGTNPGVIQKLLADGAIVHHNDRLHAKVYIGKRVAVVGSANASANGLGLEEAEQAHWIEAAVEVPNPVDQAAWFEKLWDVSPPVEQADIERAWEIFRRKRQQKLFSAFDPEMMPLPLVSWYSRAEWEIDHGRLRAETGSDDDAVATAVEWGEQSSGDEDAEILQRTHWILRWRINRDGSPSKAAAPYWARIEGRLVRKVWRLEEAVHDVVLGSKPMPGTEPFDPTEKRFVVAFRQVIAQSEFSALRDLDYPGSFFTQERVALTREFWRALKRTHAKAATAALP